MKRYELHKKNKLLPHPVLLDYIDGALSPAETEVLEEYLAENPDDLLVIEGAELFYELEDSDRDGLEEYLDREAADLSFLEDLPTEPEEEPLFGGGIVKRGWFEWVGQRSQVIRTISLVASVVCLVVLY